MKILIGSASTVNSKNTDNQVRIDFENSEMLFDEDVLYNIVDETVQFQNERNTCTNYLLYGKVESFIDVNLYFNGNILNTTNYVIELGYISSYEPDSGYQIPFIQTSPATINISNTSMSFLKDDVVIIYNTISNFYISKILDISGNTIMLDIDPTINLSGFTIVPSSAVYKRHFTPRINENYLKFYNSSFSTNIFDDPLYQFHTYGDINISGLTNNLGLPLSELVFRFTNKTGGITVFSTNQQSIITDLSIIDYVIYDLNNLLITPYDDITYLFDILSVDYKYKPYWVKPIRVFSNTLTKGTIDTLFNYPDYAFIFNSGDVFFKELLDIGYFEEGSNGLDYPFLNGMHYLYFDNKFVIRRNIPIADYTLLGTSTDTSNSYDVTAVSQLTSNGSRLC